MDQPVKELFEAALRTRNNAYAPITHFKVGSAVRTRDNRVYAGCNIESITFNNSTHAEMNAIDTAVAEGAKEISALLVVIDSPKPIFPCALCRQKIIEFGPQAEVIAATVSGDYAKKSITELYPEPFVSL